MRTVNKVWAVIRGYSDNCTYSGEYSGSLEVYSSKELAELRQTELELDILERGQSDYEYVNIEEREILTSRLQVRYRGRWTNLADRSHDAITQTEDSDHNSPQHKVQIKPSTQMIELQKNYVLTLSEQQAQELYSVLKDAKSSGHVCLDTNHELVLVYHKLYEIFGSRPWGQ